jgi:hypothetical protein
MSLIYFLFLIYYFNDTINKFIKQIFMSKSEIIQFRFPTVRQKLQNLFPFDPKYDI